MFKGITALQFTLTHAPGRAIKIGADNSLFPGEPPPWWKKLILKLHHLLGKYREKGREQQTSSQDLKEEVKHPAQASCTAGLGVAFIAWSCLWPKTRKQGDRAFRLQKQRENAPWKLPEGDKIGLAQPSVSQPQHDATFGPENSFMWETV